MTKPIATYSDIPTAAVVNKAGGKAYRMSPKHALSQLATTGTFNGVFYASANSQLSELRDLIERIDDNQFLAKLALYSRQRAYMKDMPAALLVALSTRDNELTHRIFDRIVDNGRMIRTVFKTVRSGLFGRRGLSSSLKRAFQYWLNEASVSKLLNASIGNDPSLRDVLRMARPKPANNPRRALYGWLAKTDPGKWSPATSDDLPVEVQLLKRYRLALNEQEQAAIVAELPIRWDLLADTAKGPAVWAAIARRMGPQALRMNLNTLLRQGVFETTNKSWIAKIAEAMGLTESTQCMVDFVAEKLSNVDDIVRSRQFPYQFLSAYMNAGSDVPDQIKSALQQAAEVACGQVPVLPGPVVIGLDTSGSMKTSVTGYRKRGAYSKVRCVDVAAMFAAAILRRNPDSLIVPFDTQAYSAKFGPDDTILSVASKLSRYGGGGTDCSVPLRHVNQQYPGRAFAGAILVSDNESWVVSRRAGSTGLTTQWRQFVAKQRSLQRFADPKLICIDIQPYGTVQAPESRDILNVGGFSDAVFKTVSMFLVEDQHRFLTEIESVEL